MIENIDRFLLRELEKTSKLRDKNWSVDKVKEVGLAQFLSSKRSILRQQIGMVDQRIENPTLTVESTIGVGEGPLKPVLTLDGCEVYHASWPVFEGVRASGCIALPKDSVVKFCCVLIPDAGQSPEQMCGLGEASNTTALQLARSGGAVIVPAVVSRTEEPRNGRSVLTDQEYIYRAAFVLGRHLLGYQVQESIAAIDSLSSIYPNRPIMIGGWGEGGWIAQFAGAIDTRIAVTCVSGHFGPRETLWKEPIHRNVQGLLNHFGDAEIALLFDKRNLVVDAIPGPSVEIAGKGAGPGRLEGPSNLQSREEWGRASALSKNLGVSTSLQLVVPSSEFVATNTLSRQALEKCMQAMKLTLTPVDSARPIALADVKALQRWNELQRKESVLKWDRFQQRVLEAAANERKDLWNALQGVKPSEYEKKIEPFRERFREEVIGDWHRELLAWNARTNLVYDDPQWIGYEVVLDVFDEVFAYGVLLLPKSQEPVRGRPCVVFQHGLEGRPKDTIEGDHAAYHDVCVQLVKQGYVVFAPQNPYLFQDRFRTLQRKSNPMGKTLFSIIVPQHQQIVRWLASREEIDPKRIAFYGLSYGGKSAMRIPALVPEYCLSICSADFNDWVWKNASTTSPYSYVWTNEYEIFEFGLGRSFNYAEMAALIAPRPFMVERGHQDGVAPDERVAFEFAKVKRLYTTVLHQSEKCEIEWFDGPHTIHGKGTFDFLAKHLQFVPNGKQP